MRLFNNKKGYEMWMIVTAISSLTLLVVLLIVYSGVFKGDTDSVCKLSALANAKVRIPGVSVESYKIDCDMDTIIITMQDLKKGSKQAERKIKEFNKKFKDEYEYDLNPENPRDQQKWVMNKIIANELKRWWHNLGSGSLNGLFGNWWAPFGCSNPAEATEEEGECSGFQKLKFWNWGTEYDNPPKYCVIGTRIKFDQKVQDEFGEDYSLFNWLRFNPIPYTDESYYEYLLDDSVSGINEQGLFSQSYSYDTSEPYAVVFVKINKHMLVTAAESGLAYLGEKPLEAITTGLIAKSGVSMLSTYGAAAYFVFSGGGSYVTDATSVESEFDAILFMPYSKLNETCTVIAN